MSAGRSVEVRYVLDASALLSLVLGEPGSEWVGQRIHQCGLSVVNLEEVLSRLADRGGDAEAEYDDLVRLGLVTLPFDIAEAIGSARLRPLLVKRGLSLGDRVCLATASRRNVPAVTADGAWTKRSDGTVPKRAQLEGVTVLQLRPRAAN